MLKQGSSESCKRPSRSRRITAGSLRMGIVVLTAGMAIVTAPLLGGASAAARSKVGGEVRAATATFSVGPNMRVSIVGGGPGSNCTKDETSDSFVTKGDDERHTFGFYAKTGGSCDFERSYSYFVVRVKDAAGKEIGSGDMWFGQSALYGFYHVTCGPEGSFSGLGCAVTGDQYRTHDLKITLALNGARSKSRVGKRRLGDFVTMAGATFDVGAGYKVDITGGGGGTSNCTKDETTTSFISTAEPKRVLYQMVARNSGVCWIEFSWSDFKVALRDMNQGGRVVGTGRMWLGQLDPVIGYRASCESGDPQWSPSRGPGPRPYVWDRLKCVTTAAYEVKITRP